MSAKILNELSKHNGGLEEQIEKQIGCRFGFHNLFGWKKKKNSGIGKKKRFDNSAPYTPSHSDTPSRRSSDSVSTIVGGSTPRENSKEEHAHINSRASIRPREQSKVISDSPRKSQSIKDVVKKKICSDSRKVATKSGAVGKLTKDPKRIVDSQEPLNSPPVSKISQKFLYGGNERHRRSCFEYGDVDESNFGVTTPPRFSLDSKSNDVKRGGEVNRIGIRNEKYGCSSPSLQVKNSAKKPSTNVVAVLMGLEAISDTSSPSRNKEKPSKSCESASQYKPPIKVNSNNGNTALENVPSRQISSPNEKITSPFGSSKIPRAPHIRMQFELDKAREAEALEIRRLQFSGVGSHGNSLHSGVGKKTRDQRPKSLYRLPIENSPAKYGKFAVPCKGSMVEKKPANMVRNLKSLEASYVVQPRGEKTSPRSSNTGCKANSYTTSSHGNNTIKSRRPLDHEIVTPRRNNIMNKPLQRELPKALVPQHCGAKNTLQSQVLNNVRIPSSSDTSKQRTAKAEIERKERNLRSRVKEREGKRGLSPVQSPKSSAGNSAGKRIGPDIQSSTCHNKMKMKGKFEVEPEKRKQNSRLHSPAADGETSMLSDSEESYNLSSACMKKPGCFKTKDVIQHEAETNYIGTKDLDGYDKSLFLAKIAKQTSTISTLDLSIFPEDCYPCMPLPGFSNNSNFHTTKTSAMNVLDINSLKDDVKLDELNNEAVVDSAISIPTKHSNDDTSLTYSYIAEILSTSRLLEETRAHPLGFYSTASPLDPQLFTILEQRWLDSANEYDSHYETYNSKVDQMERKRTFDTVSQILSTKLSSYMHPYHWIHTSKKIQRKRPTKQELLKQVWDEFKHMASNYSIDVGGSWTDHASEITEIVLDIEKRILNDLISETILEMRLHDS